MPDTPPPQHATPPRPRSRRLRRWILWPLVLLLFAAFVAGWWVTRPQRLTRIAAGILQSATHADVQLAEARLVWTEGLYLTGLRLSVPGVEHGDVFAADSIRINPAWLSLLTAQPAADDIVLVRPTFYLTEDIATGRYLFEQLQRGDDDHPLSRVPRITVREGRIIFREIDAGSLADLGALELEGQLTGSPDSDDEYRFVLHQRGESPADAATVSGTFSLRQPRFAAVIDGFRFEQPQRYFLRNELRAWWSRLEPAGAFSTLAVAYDADRRWSAHLVLEDAAINIPLGDYTPRMTAVTGRLRVDGHSLVLDELAGDIHGLHYQVTGRVEDLREKDAARFAFSAVTNWFHLAPDPAVVAQLPPQFRKYYDRFQPEGQFQLEVNGLRAQVGGPIDFDGRVLITDASGIYHKFAYPGRDVRGIVRFNQQQVVIEQLAGRGPGDVRFAIDAGRIWPPGDGAQVQLAIRAWNLPIDDQLRNAMEPEHNQVLDLFLPEPERQRLIDAGLLDPAWTLGGVIPELHVSLHRPAGDDVDVAVTTVVKVDGLRTIYRDWPYPLTIDAGSLTIAPDRVEVDLRVAGPTGATGRLAGSLERRGDEELFPDLRIEDAAVPVDGLLVASLPSPQNQWVTDLHVTGFLRGEGAIRQAEGERTTFNLQAQLTDARAAPHAGAFVIDPLAASLLIERGRLTIHQLTGAHGDARLSLTGELDWSRDPIALNLELAADDLPIDPAALDLLPTDHPQRAALAAMFQQHQPAGVTDLTVRYQRDGDDHYSVTIAPSELALQLPAGPAAFTAMTGSATVEAGAIHLDRLAGDFDDAGHAAVTGTVRTGDAPQLDLQLAGRTLWVGPTLRALLPPAATRVVDAIELDGAIRLDHATLHHGPDATTFDGHLRLEDARFAVGVDVTRLHGLARLRTSQQPGQAHPRVSLDLHADRLRAADRLVRELDVRIASSDDGQRLHVHEFLGSMYGGAVLGEGAIEWGDDPRFAFALTLEDVELGPFIDPTRAAGADTPHPAGEPSLEDSPQRRTGTGLFSADLSIEAAVHRPSSRTGRGAVVVRDATLYNHPLPLAVLQTLNLTLPTDRSFHAASARYLIAGDTVLLDTIRFDAPSLVVSGAGTLDWPSRRLDLEMVTRNPGMPDLGAVGEVINKFKDELLAIRITGPLGDPRGSVVTLSGLRRSWDELFSGKAARP